MMPTAIRTACCDIWLYVGNYQGWPWATNLLLRHVHWLSPGTPWLIAGGDDMDPEPEAAPEEIARQCEAHFGGTYGVMQPTGDRWGVNPDHPNPAMRSAYIDRVCGSAWIGREFARRVNQGKGPLWPEYKHMFVDEELQGVAQKLGVLWQR